MSRTASSVRVRPAVETRPADSERPRGWRVWFVSGISSAVLGFGVWHLVTTQTHAVADGGADSTLFALTNQDRASNGVHALNFNGTLENVGEAAPYHCGGLTIYGRSLDMIQRNYFSHVIPGCGTYVWPMMQAYGIHYYSAGENIGWVSGAGGGSASASYINGQFMNSPDHRANILNGNYTDLGVGSAEGNSWTGAGSPASDVWMFSEEFAQLGAAPPPPPPPPAPRPTGGTPRNSPAPAAPGQPPTSTQLPTAAPSATPAPTPTPVPAALLPVSAYPPPVFQSAGLLPDSIESVLEAFLVA